MSSRAPLPAGPAAAVALAWLLVPLATGARAADAPAPATEPALLTDPVLVELVGDALAKRPELAAALATVRAERERIPQADALPDPVLTLGIQNDSFTSIQIGEAETSYLLIMASQTLPWFGKRGLRAELAGLGAQEAELVLERLRLSIRAEVERGYVELLLLRDRLGIQQKLEALWGLAEGLARSRYEAGVGAQSDLLRAQLEQSRLRQRRFALVAREAQQVAALNRLRGHAQDEPIGTTRSLEQLPDPTLPELAAALADAEARSPELRQALLASQRAATSVSLARAGRYPDVTVSAGVMPRGGLSPMWQAGVAIPIPISSGSKQDRALSEGEARVGVAGADEESVRRLVAQRVHERLPLLGALLETLRLYRSGLLVQSDATVSSTLAQFRVGQVTFASVLEALAGYLADREGFLESVAATHALSIALREVSLGPADASGVGAAGGMPVPGARAAAASDGGAGASSPPGM